MTGTSISQAASTFDASGYWYSDEHDRATALLNSLRHYRQAERDMRARTQTSMRMGETDLAAIRFLLREQRAGRSVGSKMLSEHLGITTASTAVLINRLERSGHITRHRNPADGRGVLLTANDNTDDEVRATMAGMHARMIRTAENVPPDIAAGIIAFLREMTDNLDVPDQHHA